MNGTKSDGLLRRIDYCLMGKINKRVYLKWQQLAKGNFFQLFFH